MQFAGFVQLLAGKDHSVAAGSNDGQRARGGSAEETGRLILRVNDLPAGGKLTMSAAEYRLAKAALNQLRTQRLAEGGYTDAVDDALTRLLHAHTPLFIW